MLIEDITHMPAWLSHHAHLWLAGAANAVAWGQSFNTGNFSVGTVVTVCTIAVPAVGGAVIYIIKTVGPVWLKFIEDRDRTRSSTMAGQMERLNRNLEEERESGAAKAEIAKQLKLVADLATRRADLVASNNFDLSAQLAEVLKKLDEAAHASQESAERIEDINAKLHTANGALAAAEARALNAEHDTRLIREKLDQALAKLGQNTAKFDDNTAKLDVMTAKVAGITEFGAAVASAADVLVHPPEVGPADRPSKDSQADAGR